MQVYLVGGAVRDGLLNLTVYDRDWVVVGSSPQEMLDKGFKQVGKDFPVFLHPKTKEEYALARMERKSGQGYHGFEMDYDSHVTLEEDLIRRDLTINAMAQDEQGHIIDPYQGQQDLQDKVLRHVSEAFAEDPLRVLRVARFAAKLAPLGFQVAPSTLQLMNEMTESGELSALTPERVWQEVVKALSTDTPSVFFEVLDAVGALKVLFPELKALQGVEQPVKYHPEGDVWRHTMMVLDQACQLSDDIEVRFAALTHDLGKALTPPELWPSHHGHEKAGVPLVKALCQRYHLPNHTTWLAEKVAEYHGLIHQGLNSEHQPALKPKTYLKVLTALQVFKKPNELQRILLACEADAKGRLGFENRAYPQKDFWLSLAETARQFTPQIFIEQGLQGKAISEAIETQKRSLIAAFLKETFTREVSHQASE